MSTPPCQSNNHPRNLVNLTYLEFYSGVGGWSYALHEACKNVNEWLEEKDQNQNCSNNIRFESQCLAAYDHSDLCYKVFHHNFPGLKKLSSCNGKNQIRKDGGSISNDSSNCDDKMRPKRKKQKKHSQSTPSHFGQKPVSIEKLTKKQLEHAKAVVWMMSPPCQPHTRQHTNQEEDVNDPRSKSFLHLCNLISTMTEEALPKIILLENVIGFEKSNSCKYWRRALFSRKYSILHFHLNPTQVGLPNDRPRYYSLAILREKQNDGEVGNKHVGKKYNDCDTLLSSIYFSNCAKVDSQDNLNFDPPIHFDIKDFNVKKENSDEQNGINKHLLPISSFLDPIQNDNHTNTEQKLTEENAFTFVSEKILKSNASWCFDIVTPYDKRSACFTSSYGKFIRGTGSVLYVGDKNAITSNPSKEENDSTTVKRFQLLSPTEREFDKNWNGMDLSCKLRYFTGKEIARLMGFPMKESSRENIHLDDCKEVGTFFSFPPDCTQKQCWKLMGNSLNVKVAGKIAELALRMYVESHNDM